MTRTRCGRTKYDISRDYELDGTRYTLGVRIPF